MKNRRGLTLIEILIATLIMGIVVVGLLNIGYMLSHKGAEQNDRSFANQKAMQMMEEMRSLVSGAEDNDVAVLDDYDNGTGYSALLTTDRTTTDPAAPLSGNTKINNGWKYLRRVTVQKLAEEAYARKVFVRVYKTSRTNPTAPEIKLAETMSVLKTIKGDFVPTQVMDVYFIAIGNVSGWWSNLASIRDSYGGVVQNIQSRNPGMEIRPHWITKLSYGRDLYYTPYLNETTRTDAFVMPYVYFYPGLVPDQYGNDYTYFASDEINERLNVDGSVVNPATYTLCDQYNHALRYPDEEALYNSLVAAAESAHKAPPEPSLRMVLEKLNVSTAPYKNAIFINLHGELLPVPPLRNYSDAAKDPGTYGTLGYRAVTHPEQIHYNSGEEVVLRVYPYIDSSGSGTPGTPDITIFLPGLTVTPTVSFMEGDATHSYQWTTGDYTLTNLAGGTRIVLHNTPFTHPLNSSALGYGGLPAAQKLYGMEYIPSPLSTTAGSVDFTRDLTVNSSSLPKNTARWKITIPSASIGNRLLTVETRLGTNNTATGTWNDKPENLSRTYAWHGVTLPATEKYQLVGDPRHCPYKDAVADKRYNWNFYNLSSDTTNWPPFVKTRQGWRGYLDMDVDRAFQLFREGLVNSQAIWSAITGFSYYYYGLGGEFGSDMPPLSSSVKFYKQPWYAGSVSGTGYYNEIQGAGYYAANSANTWWSKTWLGELYPDSAYTAWTTAGNLPTGAGNYYRATKKSLVGPSGSNERTTVTQELGCAAFFNGKPLGQTGPFMHVSADNSATLTDIGLEMSAVFNYTLASVVASARPFTLNYGGSYPPAWSESTYSLARSTLSLSAYSGTNRIYYTSGYNSGSYYASSVIKMAYNSNAAYVVVSGLTTQATAGSSQLASYSLISLLYTFLDGGLYSDTASHIVQLPRVELSSPTITDEFVNATSVPMQWGHSWLRWDGQPYTGSYSSSYSESAALVYIPKYSADNGNTWRYCLDGALTRAGAYDGYYAQSSTSFTWDVSSLAKGSYILRVEAYRSAIPLHYSYDQVNVYLRS